MKRLLFAALTVLSVAAFGATTTPVQLLNPTGSTAGQAILSTGPSSAPVWGAVPLTGITGTLAITNGGTGATTASVARTNLGLGTAAIVNTGTSGATIPLLNTANTWALGQIFTVRPTFNGATPYDTGNLTIANYGLLANPLSQFAPTTSAQLAGVLSDETGTGVVVFNANPALTSPVLTGGTGTTAAFGTNTTALATTAFVQAALPPGYTSYSPSIAASSGTYTTASAAGSYSQAGKLVCVRVVGTITAVGTGTSTIIGLPVAAASTNSGIQVLSGRENTGGKMLQGFIGAGASTMTIVDYTNASAAANGALEIVSGCYISA